MKFLIVLLQCLFLFVPFSVHASAAAPYTELKLLGHTQAMLTDPKLSQAQWEWLRKKRTLLLGASAPNYPPFDITSGINDYGGISADYLAMIASNLNIDVSVRYFPDYQAMIDALEDGEIDLIANAGSVENQRNGLILSQPYVASAPVFVKREQSHDIPNDGPQKIAIDKIFPENGRVSRQFPQAQRVNYDSPRRALEDLAFRQLDYYIGNSTTVQYLINQANLNTLQIHPLADTPNEDFAFAATKNNQVLIAIINKVLEQIPGNVKIDILRRWSGGIPLGLSDRKLQLTPLELKWIAAHPRISVAVSQNFAPLSFFDDNGRYRGFTADLLNAISARTGLTFNVKNVGTLSEVLRSTQRGDADVAAGITLDSIWPNGLLTTRTYLFNSWVLVGKKNAGTTPKNIALQSGHPLEVFLREQYHDVNILSVETPREGLDLVVQGKADTMVLPLIAADFLLPRYYAGSLQIITSLDTDPARFALGVSPEDYPLVTILDKAMLNIQPEDLHALTSNWYSDLNMREGEMSAHTYTTLSLRNDLLTGGVISASLLAMLLLTCRHRRQQRLIAELRLAREAADSASRAKTIFLATMSHEIRTPVSAIIGSLELVLRRRKADAGDWDVLQRSYDSAHSLLALMGDILDIARIESDRLVLHPQRANIRQLMESTAAMFEGLAREKELDYRLEIDAEIQGDVLIDPLRFKQVLSNMLSNAVKFTEQGAVLIRVTCEPSDSEHMGLRIDIEDSGCGIGSDQLQRLFLPFSQASGSQTGSGLGLYICRSLLGMMGGDIALISQPKSGTTATARLAVLRLEPLPSRKTPALPVVATGNRQLTILIAEDHPAARHLLEQQLTFLGHRAISVCDGQQALQRISEQKVDLVITDCNMPRLNGYKFTQRLRQREQASGCTPLPVWAITAAAQPASRESCLQAGMNDCLFKPVDLNQLAEKLQRFTRQSNAPEHNARVFDPDNLPAELAAPATQRAFLSLLANSLDEDLALLNDWLQTPDASPEVLQALLHRIRGGIRPIGAESLSQQCAQMEDTTTHPEEPAVRELMVRLERLSQAIKAQRDKLASEDYS